MGSSFLISAFKQATVGLLIYGGIVFFSLKDSVQVNLLYLNWINLPAPSKLLTPEVLGFPLGKIKHFYIDSTDGVRLGAWQILPTKLYEEKTAQVENFKEFEQNFYLDELKKEGRDVVIYFHGNAANRGQSIRYPTYKAFGTDLDSHVITIDYRGFGESNGTPSEEGLFQDALATWNWVTGLGISPNRISIVGHSLGTGVSFKLVSYLNSIGIQPKSMILTAAYMSIREAMFDYKLFKFIPLLYPLKLYPDHKNLAVRFLKHQYDSLSVVPKITTPTLLFHGVKDKEIGVHHSWELFAASKLTYGSEFPDYKPEEVEVPGVGRQVIFHPKGSSTTKKTRPISIVEVTDATHNNIPEFPIFLESIKNFWNLL